jgi:ABC-type polysaccharide/polyol phosphate transport system ATPase subunit
LTFDPRPWTFPFDTIVAFAEVEKFLDTPVKRHSIGMYVRLAFAVAAHLEPEILLVDEERCPSGLVCVKLSIR